MRKKSIRPMLAFEVLKSRNGEWYYQVLHRNGKEKFRSSETYKRKSTLLRSLTRDLSSIKAGDYEFID